LLMALERPTVNLKVDASPGGREARVEIMCNCPEGEKRAREAARAVENLVRLKLEFKRSAPRSPFSCRVCRPLMFLVAASLARGSPQSVEDVEMLLSFEESAILRTMFLGGMLAFHQGEGGEHSPAGPWMLSYHAPPPGLRVVLARLPGESVDMGDRGHSILMGLSLISRMLWEGEVAEIPRILEKLARSLGREDGIPLLPVEEDGGEWFLAPLPSPDECSLELIEYREKLAGFLDERSKERIVTRLSIGGVVEVE